jgi:tRNA-(ms[2]io[6]A)-hydroxylase
VAATDGAAPHVPPLAAPTPDAWFEAAVADLPTLLLDHANCEKKAASTALALMFAYADDATLCRQLSRLAREELRHFEQVERLLAESGVGHRRLAPSRYAESLRRVVAQREPHRKLDLLLVGALIELRSCERFTGLVPRLPPPLAAFYAQLLASEARHGSLYLGAARRHAAEHGLDADERLAALAELEAGLATAPDRELRFHSGPPESGLNRTG